MTADEVVARARRCIGAGCRYVLGAGGINPASPAPWDGSMGCDCSGFAMWALGLSRHYHDAVWFDTSRIVDDAKHQQLLFRQVAVLEARAGDLYVYGDAGGHQGHVGVIASVTLQPETWPLTVVHCSAGNFRRTGDAIRETGPDIWLHRDDAIIARCVAVAEAPPA